MNLLQLTLPLGRIAGIPIRLHLSAFLLIALVFHSLSQEVVPIGQTLLFTSIFMITLWGSVIAHEFGHILAARHYGYRTLAIYLSVLGGMAALEDLPRGGRKELIIAIAGPLVSLSITALALICTLATSPLLSPQSLLYTALMASLWINALLLLFNLIPAYPLDGGRMLRALLAMRMPYRRASRIASIVGFFLGSIFLIIGAYNTSTLSLIGLFVLVSCWAEYTTQEPVPVIASLAPQP